MRYTDSLKYGLIAGIIMIVIILVIYFIDMTKLAGFLPLIIYVPLIFLMIWGGVTIRREKGSFSGFGDAFLTIFIISVTATMLFDTFGYVLYKVIDPELPNVIKAKAIENTSAMMEKFGATDDKIDEAIKRVKDQDYTPTIKYQAMRYAFSIFMGAVFSLIIGAFVNRSDGRPQVKVDG
jgi:hypothetical protein